MWRPTLILLLIWLDLPISADDAESGFSLPAVISVGAFQSRRLTAVDDAHSNLGIGFRAVLDPTLTLGDHWLFYSSIQFSRSPYFYYNDSYVGQNRYQATLLESFLAYSRTSRRASTILKAGRLASAFGSFPMRYEDTQNPLLDQPLSYGSTTRLRADQIPCGVGDIRAQRNPSYDTAFDCGGSSENDAAGLLPVTLTGLIGLEAEFALGKADARVQVTNSSPSNPQSLLSPSQRPQWTAGAGYKLRPGVRVGLSAFRGPYLDSIVRPFLPPGRTIGSYPASALGVDAQWNWRRLSGGAEWQRFQYAYPTLTIAPALTAAYAESKVILTPRWYAAARIGYEWNNRIADSATPSPVASLLNWSAYEAAIGFRPNRWQLLKIGYQWRHLEGYSGSLQNVVGIQYVTSFNAGSRSIR